MNSLFIIFLILPYCILLLAFTVGVVLSQRKKQPSHSEAFISVIIAARNEEENIEEVINSILAQDYPSSNFEIIVVDDHSDDATIIRIPRSPIVRIVVLPNGSFGKKAALKAGVETALFPYIAATDADCIASPFWLKTLAGTIKQKHPALIVGPVSLPFSNSFLETFQHWEFRALQMVTFGSAALKYPTLCNGANLCFSRDEYNRVNLKEEETPSGDDIFLLHHLLKGKKAVEFCLSKEMLITSKPETAFYAMLQQKIRWASKSKHITNPATLALGGITFITNLIAVAVIPYTIVNPERYISISLIWGPKIIAEAILVFVPGKKVYGAYPKTASFILSALLMPFYATFVALASLFLKFTWKKRTQS